MSLRTLLGITLLITSTVLSGCVGSDDGEGSASFYVKDAPTDEFSEIHVLFTKIEVHAASDDSDDNATDDDSGWITVYENATGTDLDLLQASDPNQAFFLGEANLSEGRYTQIRVHTDSAYGIDHDGERIDFALAPTPLKIVRSFEINATMETRIVLDFDLDRALVQQGPNGWRMTPVIGKTLVEEVDNDESGADVHAEGELTEV